jgi:hypothetical protein
MASSIFRNCPPSMIKSYLMHEFTSVLVFKVENLNLSNLKSQVKA